jgi:hypothetical protein
MLYTMLSVQLPLWRVRSCVAGTSAYRNQQISIIGLRQLPEMIINPGHVRDRLIMDVRKIFRLVESEIDLPIEDNCRP